MMFKAVRVCGQLSSRLDSIIQSTKANVTISRVSSRSWSLRGLTKVILTVGVVQAPVNLRWQSYSPVQIQQKLVERRTVSIVLIEILELCRLICRSLYLLFIYIPVFTLYPLTSCGEAAKQAWWSLFLKGIETSGPIFIKLGQWASTRRDIFSEEMCNNLGLLQRMISPHSWFYTQQQLKRAFGENWTDIFCEMNPTPIGSGCIAQVYKAHVIAEAFSLFADRVREYDARFDFYEVLDFVGIGRLLSCGARTPSISEHFHNSRKAIPVAVKVLHPGIQRQFERDLSIMQFAARLLTTLFPQLHWLSPIECVEEFKHLMSAQINLKVEACNLDCFAKNFEKNRLVKFPTPLWPYVTSHVMVESFEEGAPISSYLNRDKAKVKCTLADIGVDALLNMIFVHNLVHGDLHPGNLLVQKVDVPQESSSSSWLRRRRPSAEASDQPVSYRLVILDCGITTRLSNDDQKNLKDVFTAIVNKNGRLVAELFLERSPHHCLNHEGFKKDMATIIEKALDKTISLGAIEVGSLMQELFSCLLTYHVKLEGKFTSVILAVMVLEGLGRSLNPHLDILEKAKPLLLSFL